MKVVELFKYGRQKPPVGTKKKSLTGNSYADIWHDMFNCSKNELTSLEGCPSQILGTFLAAENDNLSNLKGGPKFVEGNYSIYQCRNLTSLEGIASRIGNNLRLKGCDRLSSLQGIHKLFKGGYIQGAIELPESRNSLTSHILGLLLIPELTYVKNEDDIEGPDLRKAVAIINKHLQGDRDVIDCQQEMIEAGLKQYAQL